MSPLFLIFFFVYIAISSVIKTTTFVLSKSSVRYMLTVVLTWIVLNSHLLVPWITSSLKRCYSWKRGQAAGLWMTSLIFMVKHVDSYNNGPRIPNNLLYRLPSSRTLGAYSLVPRQNRNLILPGKTVSKFSSRRFFKMVLLKIQPHRLLVLTEPISTV